MMYSRLFKKGFAWTGGFVLWVCILPSVVRGGNLIVPVRVIASSNGEIGKEQSLWHVSTLMLGAKHYDKKTGSNAPYGLSGYQLQVQSCMTAVSDGVVPKVDFPVHDDYRSELSVHPKSRGMWMSKAGDQKDAWVEFELSTETTLGQIWIWNWNDAPEIGRRVRHVTVQTSTNTTSAEQLGSVDYNITHKTLTLPNKKQMPARIPDVVYSFPPGTRTRYVRLHDMDNFGPDRELGLAEVFILGAEQSEFVTGTVSQEVVTTVEAPWHLFLDDHSVTRSTGFQQVLHYPEARGVVLRPEKPWETFGVTPWYVGQRKDGLYECYYQTLWWKQGGGSTNRIAYAISKDGIDWEKPDLNLVEGPTEIHKKKGFSLGISGGKKSMANNILPCGHPRDLFLHGNVTDPQRRYAIGLDFRVGQRVGFCSELPDFINDPDWREKIIDSGGFKPSHYNALEFWDDIHNEWVAMRQAPNHPPVRCGGRYASPDLKNWNLEHYVYPDARDSTDPRYFDEVYGIMGVHMEGIVFGFLQWFIGDRTHSNQKLYEDGHNKPTIEEGLIGKSVSKGTMEVRVATSRDGGITWDRTVSREAWIRHGEEQHSYDRLVRMDCPPLRMGDEDWFYATVYNGDHAGQNYYHNGTRSLIQGALYVQKHNRYVSMRSGNIPQILITKPIKVTGKTLQLNVDSSHGKVLVGLGIDQVIPHKFGAWPFKAILPHYMVEDRWEESHLVEGFHVNDCQPIQSDCIEYNVRWKTTNLESLLGETVRLYIMVQDADLYGFRFR